MPVEVNCPQCDKKLRVPDNLLGKTVKCPACGTMMTTSAPEPPSEPEPPRRAPREESYSEEPRRRRPADEEADDRPRRRPRDDEDDDRPRRRREEDDDDAEYDDEPRRRRGGRRRRRAKEAVNAPGMCLLITGIIAIVLGVLNVVVIVVGFGIDKNADGSQTTVRLIGAVLNFVWAGIVTMGGWKMRELSSRGSVMTACIFAMLPCSGCCILGLPFGIWGLVVISKPEVKDAFS